LALAIAEHHSGEIVSVDSMQVYREMDIGTSKPDPATRWRVPHHLIDVAEPEESFTVAQYQAAGRSVLDALEAEGTPAVIAGGSGLHFRALVDPMSFAPTEPALRAELEAAAPADLVTELLAVDPHAATHVDLANPRRVVRAVETFRLTGATPAQRAGSPEAAALRSYTPRMPLVALGVDPGDSLPARVTSRFDAMLGAGLLDEVASLAPRLGRSARQAVGYKELIPVVAGRVSIETGRDAAIQATLALAKRQRTFFRRDPRICWLPWHDDPDQRAAAARRALEEVELWTS
jgi:tRNA dimethylallyltransferase